LRVNCHLFPPFRSPCLAALRRQTRRRSGAAERSRHSLLRPRCRQGRSRVGQVVSRDGCRLGAATSSGTTQILFVVCRGTLGCTFSASI
jgi:hypothetical protein